MMNSNKDKHPEYLELDSQRNIGIVTIKQMERIEMVLTYIAAILSLSFIGGIICIL